MRILIFFIATLFWLQSYEAQAYQDLKKTIEKSYGIEIEFDNIQFNGDLKGEVTAKPHTSSKILREGSLKELQTDLSKYSKNLIRKFVKKVYIVDHLKLRDKKIAGTFDNSSGSIYVIRGYIGGINPYATVFHHELSSLLLYTYFRKGFYQQWLSLNPPGFVYFIKQNSGINSLDGDTDIDGHEKFYQQGFVFGYGTVSFQEDFNTFFELMIGDPVRLANLEVKYPNIRKKAELLRQFYYGIILQKIQPITHEMKSYSFDRDCIPYANC